MRAVLPYIKPDYFEGIYRILFKEAGKFVAKYNKLPNAEAFKIQLDETESLSEEQYKLAIDILPNLFSEEEVNSQWLNDSTEKWCQDRALHNAIMESITIIEGKHAQLTKNALPDILSKALSVSFDNMITAYLRVTTPVGAYLKIGYTEVDLTTEENLGTGGAYGNTTLEGMIIGVGYNHDLPNGMFVRGEANLMDFDDVKLTNTADSTKSVEATGIEGYGARVSVGKSF